MGGSEHAVGVVRGDGGLRAGALPDVFVRGVRGGGGGAAGNDDGGDRAAAEGG